MFLQQTLLVSYSWKKLSAAVSCVAALPMLRSHWPAAAVRHRCPRPGSTQPGTHKGSTTENHDPVLVNPQSQHVVPTSCSCAASIRTVPTPHIGSSTREPGWETGDTHRDSETQEPDPLQSPVTVEPPVELKVIPGSHLSKESLKFGLNLIQAQRED